VDRSCLEAGRRMRWGRGKRILESYGTQQQARKLDTGGNAAPLHSSLITGHCTHVELGGGQALAILGGNSGSSDDLDGLVARSVATSHVVVYNQHR
jgi:hypothetical protein